MLNFHSFNQILFELNNYYSSIMIECRGLATFN